MPQGAPTKRGWLKLLTKLSGSIGIVGVVIGSFSYSNPNSPNWNPNDYAMYEIWAVAVAPLCVCLLLWVIVATNWWWDQVTLASKRLPAPTEIFLQLEAAYGRPPTIDEVAAVHEMLLNSRTESLVNTGIGLGTFYAIQQNVHR